MNQDQLHIPRCIPSHHGNSGPYCEECQSAEYDAYETACSLSEMAASADDAELGRQARLLITAANLDWEIV